MPRIISLANVQQFAAVNLSDGGYHKGPKIIPNACQVVLRWTLGDGKIGHNVLYAQYTGTPALSAAVAEQIRAGLVGGATWTALALLLAPITALAGVTIIDVRSSVATAFDSTGAATPGTAGSAQLPDEVALVITLRTATRGPSGRGRIYIPGWANAAVGSSGVATAAAVTALQNWANGPLVTAISGAIGPLVLGLPQRDGYTSAVTGRVFDPRPATTRPITSQTVRDNHWDSQRRRGLK